MSSRNKKTRSSDERTRNRFSIQAVPAIPAVPTVPQIYPAVPGYPIPAPQWFPSHLHANYAYPWYQWQNPQPYNVTNPQWLPTTNVASASAITTPKPGSPGPDEYMVDSLRRIYNNDDGSIEIERVKVQRRQGIYETKQNTSTSEPPRGGASLRESVSFVPDTSTNVGELKPPPRKHKKRRKGANFTSPLQQGGDEPQTWYPYMPYLPQPYPYPYAYGYMWPAMHPSSTIGVAPNCQSPTDSDSSVSHQDTLPSSLQSRNLEPRDLPSDTKSGSPELHRSTSPGAGSQVTESLGTDIAPSDSVSMRGYKKKDSLEQILKKSLPNSNQDEQTSNDFQANDLEKTKEWMQNMQRVFASKLETQSESAGDRSSFATACSDIPTPPIRKNKFRRSTEAVSLTHRKSNSESNIDSQEDQSSLTSLPLLYSTRVSDSDLIYAFKKLEQSADTFKSHAATGSTKSESPRRVESTTQEGTKKVDREDNVSDNLGGRESRASTMSFHSTRQSTEEHNLDTDSTGIALPVDTSTADESADNIGSDAPPSDEVEDNYKWILQQPEEVQEISCQNENEDAEGDIKENWRAEVSLWRARLVVSLCRGQGLDQQDWGTFQLLVQHPLTMDMKLSLLHAQRLCSQNCDIGVAMLRNTLLYLTTYGETLMKAEEERSPGWKSITIDSNLSWTPIKGSMEILHVYGFRMRENGTLRYRRKCAPEVSVVARLTLDILVLAEEFRLYLTGAHQYPSNITKLFLPICDSGNSGSNFAPHSRYWHRSLETEAKLHTNAEQFQDISASPDQELTDKYIPESNSLSRDTKEYKDRTESKKRLAPQPPNDSTSNSPATVSEEIKLMVITPVSTSPEAADVHSVVSSIPDLQSPSPALTNLSDHHTESNETLSLPTTALDVTITTGNENESSVDKDNDEGNEKPGEECKKKRVSKRLGGGDNPEDHIYEEIGEIKAQVGALKDVIKFNKNLPPPLPPKTRSLNSFDLSNKDAYPQVDWSGSSQYSSVHGSSTSSRKKKRRAPMPPAFMPLDVREDGDAESDEEEQESSLKEESEFQEITSEKEKNSTIQDNLNPFYDEKLVPSGYIGKNPFYEDIETKLPKVGNSISFSINQTDTVIKASSQIESEILEKEEEPSQVTDEEFSEATVNSATAPTAVRPQRKKRKRQAPDVLKNNTSEQKQDIINDAHGSQDEKSLEAVSQTSSIVTIKELAAPNSNQVAPNVDSQNTKLGNNLARNETEEKAFNENSSEKKNLAREQQCDSHVVVSNKIIKAESHDKEKIKKPRKKEIIIQEISITYDISINEPDDEILKMNEENSKKQHQAKIKKEDNTKDKLDNIKLIHLITKNENNRLTDASNAENLVQEKESSEKVPVILPPMPPPKAPLKLLDDIPYIDVNDVNKYKDSYNFPKPQQPFPFEKPQINAEKIMTPSGSLDRHKEISAFLIQDSSSVPYMDESDEPPDCPPPPIPLSSLPETPHNSPPPSPVLFSKLKLDANVLLTTPEDNLNGLSPIDEKLEPKILLSDNENETTIGLQTNNSIENLVDQNTIDGSMDQNTIDESINQNTTDELIDQNATDDLMEDSVDQDKATVLFESHHGNCSTDEPNSAATSDNDRYDIPEPVKTADAFEERYEIPDVVRSDARRKLKVNALNKQVIEAIDKNKSDSSTSQHVHKNPKRPPRHVQPNKTPPRPPKLIYKEIPPALPPKTASLKSSLNLTSSSTSVLSNKILNTSTSLPSTLAKSHSKSSSNKIIPAPLAIPKISNSTSPNRSSTSKSVIISPRSSSLSSLPAGTYPRGIIISHPHSISHPLPPNCSALPQTTYPSAKSVSTPSSPKCSTNRTKKLLKNEKKQKSWPSVFCDCVHPSGSNNGKDEIKYVMK